MAADWHTEVIPPGEWWPTEFTTLMEFPQNIKSLLNVDGRLFATLEDGTVVDCTDLLGEAKH